MKLRAAHSVLRQVPVPGQRPARTSAALAALAQPRLRRSLTARERVEWLHGSEASLYQRLHRAWLRDPPPPSLPSARTLVVLMLFRDNAAWIERWLPTLVARIARAAAAMGLSSAFYWYENDSRDDTVAALLDLQARVPWPVQFVHERLHRHSCAGRTSTRGERMAQYRNALVGMALDRLPEATAALCVDSNLFVQQSDVYHLLLQLRCHTSIGMVAACTTSAVGPPGHYYDTYAFTTCSEQKRGHLERSVQRNYCLLAGCHRCWRAQAQQPCGPVLRPDQTDLVRVGSCFGGLAALRPAALLRTSWRSHERLCEHVMFCDGLWRAGHEVCVALRSGPQWCDAYEEVPAELLLHLEKRYRADDPWARQRTPLKERQPRPQCLERSGGGQEGSAPASVATAPALRDADDELPCRDDQGGHFQPASAGPSPVPTQA